MDITEAIKIFEGKRKGKFSPEDHEMILATVAELGLIDFDIKIRHDVITKDGEPYTQFIYDREDILHVHPTMMVARKEFSSRDPQKRSRYGKYPHFVDLSRWIDSGVAKQISCPNCFIYLPLIGRCDTCNFDLEDID